MKSIRAFVENFDALSLSLNTLINNAGVMFWPHQLSEEGIEVQFATNHIGHFLLTNLLLDKMKSTARETGIEGRIVNLSSIAHLYTYEDGIPFDLINDLDSYSDKKAYGQSKLANILHANELSRRLKVWKLNSLCELPFHNESNPGWSIPGFSFAGRRGEYHGKLGPSGTDNDKPHETFAALEEDPTDVLLPPLEQRTPGAATTCYTALHPALKGVSGKYFLDCNEMEPSAFAKDGKLAKRLWAFSQKLVDSASNSAK